MRMVVAASRRLLGEEEMRCSTAPPSVGPHLQRQPGLADARLAGQEHHAALATQGGIHPLPQEGDLPLPPYQWLDEARIRGWGMGRL